MHYNDLTWRHFEAPAHAGVLRGGNLYRGAAGSRELGTWVQFDMQIDFCQGVNTLRTLRFQAYACPHVIAVADWLAQEGVGSEAAARLPHTVASLQQRFAVPVEKLGRLLIVEDAWIAAVSTPYHPR
jgi:NifU-like protein involved in Fe-S cluster formation